MSAERHPLRQAITAMRTSPGRAALACLTGTGALSAAIALIGVSGWLISRAAQQPPVLSLMLAVVAVRALGIGRGVLRYAERLAGHDVALRGVVTLRSALYGRLAAADPAVAAGLRRGDLLSRIGADVDALGDVVVRLLLPFAIAALTGSLSVLALGLVLPWAGLVLAAGLLSAGAAAPTLAGWAARRAIRDTSAARSAMSSQVLALVDGLPQLAVAAAIADRRARLERTETDLAGGLERAARPASWAAALATTAMGAAVLGCLMAGVSAENDGRLRPVLLAVVTLVPLAAAEVVSGLPAAAVSLVRARAAAERVVVLLNAAPMAQPVNGSGVADELVGLPRPDRSGPRLRAEALDVGWPGRPAVLRGIDLDLTPGRRIAVIGASGGGKSTLLLTLAGLRAPLAGRVTLNGRDLAGLDPETVRRTVHLCADDAHVFTTTVRENLRVACPGGDDTDLRWSLERAGLSDWLAGLPAGLDTMIGDPGGPGAGIAGWPLSGGERRRLLLARAFLSGADVLLIDEPAEHLDPRTADALVEELFAAGGTVVVVTHRLAPLRAADEILLVEHGVVVARGDHAALAAGCPAYREALLAEQGSFRDPVKETL